MTEEVKQEEVKQAEPAKAPQQQESGAADLTIQDLQMMKNIIDLSAQRGAFKPGEMAAIGAVYNKLSAFLETVTKGQTNG